MKHTSKVIWRDDDIFYHEGMAVHITPNDAFGKFVEVHETLVKAELPHTIAVLAGGIPFHPTWVKYIKDRQDEFDIQLHGLVHINFPQNPDKAKENLRLGKIMIEETFGVTPTVFYPPWNLTDGAIHQICEELGLKDDAEKISLATFVESQRVPDGTVLNFHHWATSDTQYLNKAIEIYKERYV